MKQIKALTVWQPWASLIAAGLKQYETRSWSTCYRGLLAIHAAKRWTGHERLMTMTLRMPNSNVAMLRSHPELLPEPEDMPLGVVLCIARLTDVVPTTAPGFVRGLNGSEMTVGDFSPGRFAWKLEIIEVFDEPVPARGQQGLWIWTRT